MFRGWSSCPSTGILVRRRIKSRSRTHCCTRYSRLTRIRKWLVWAFLLWMSSSRGILAFLPDTTTCRKYTKAWRTSAPSWTKKPIRCWSSMTPCSLNGPTSEGSDRDSSTWTQTSRMFSTRWAITLSSSPLATEELLSRLTTTSLETTLWTECTRRSNRRSIGSLL